MTLGRMSMIMIRHEPGRMTRKFRRTALRAGAAIKKNNNVAIQISGGWNIDGRLRTPQSTNFLQKTPCTARPCHQRRFAPVTLPPARPRNFVLPARPPSRQTSAADSLVRLSTNAIILYGAISSRENLARTRRIIRASRHCALRNDRWRASVSLVRPNGDCKIS